LCLRLPSNPTVRPSGTTASLPYTRLAKDISIVSTTRGFQKYALHEEKRAKYTKSPQEGTTRKEMVG
jgi:hypothetical protein